MLNRIPAAGPLLIILLSGLPGCARSSPGTDSLPVGDSDTGTGDTDTTPPPVECTDWRLTEVQRFTQEDLFGTEELTNLGAEDGPGMTLGDFDGDGDLDGFMAVNTNRSLYFRNTDGLLELVATATADGGDLPVGTGVAASDLDDDGRMDIVLAGPLGVPDQILYNDADEEFMTRDLPSSDGMTMTPTVGDLDGDGRNDVVISGFNREYTPEQLVAGAHLGDGTHVYTTDGHRHWTDTSSSALPSVLQNDLTYQHTLVDYDSDGDQDLFATNDRGAVTRIPNMLLVNDGSGHFVNSDDCLCEYQMSGMGASVGDTNEDGLPDLLISSWGTRQLMVNVGNGTFYDNALSAGVSEGVHGDNTVSFATSMVDLDGDTHQEIVITNGLLSKEESPNAPEAQPDELWYSSGDGTYVDRVEEMGFNDTGWGRSLLIGDMNRDGVPDIVVSGRVYVIVYHGEGGCPGPTVRLDAGDGNHEGIGARVQVTTPRASFTRWMYPGVTLGQSAAELYIGLGGEAAATLDIVWPDGRASSHEVTAFDAVTLTP